MTIPMRYLLDAYNLLFHISKKRNSLEKSRQLLIQELNAAILELHLDVILVFDGAGERLSLPTRTHYDAIEIIYTAKGQTADEYIYEEVCLTRFPHQFTIVTNDRQLSERCYEHRAKTMKIHEFLRFLTKKKTKKRRVKVSRELAFCDSDPEIARLLLIFEKRLLEDL